MSLTTAGPDPQTGASSDGTVAGLVVLCESQRATIVALQAALGGHTQAGMERDRARVSLADQVRGSAAAVLGLLEPLLADDPDEAVADVVTRSCRQVEHLRDVVEEFALLSTELVTVVQAHLVIVPVAEVVADVVDAAFAQVADRPVVSTVPSGLDIRTASGRLHHLLLDLLVSAARRTSASSPIEIEAVPIDGAVAFVLADHGPGVLDGFGSVVRDPARCSYLSRQLAASLGGDLQVADRPGGGRVVRVILPQRRAADPRS